MSRFRANQVDVSENDANRDETWIIIPPDGGWGWIVVIAAFLCNFLADGTVFSFGVFIRPLCDEFEVSTGKVAIITTVNQAFYFLSGPFVSVFQNRFGSRIVTFTGGLLLSFGFGGASFARNIETLVFTNGMLSGLGVCMAYCVGVVHPGIYFGKWRALAICLAATGSTFGTVALAPSSQMLVNTYGWRITYRILSGLVLLICLLAFLFRPLKPVILLQTEDMPQYASVVPLKNKNNKDAQNSRCINNIIRMLFFWVDVPLLKSPAFQLFLWSGCTFLAGYIIPLTYIKDRAIHFNIKSQHAVWTISAIGLGNSVGRLTAGLLSCIMKFHVVNYVIACTFVPGLLSAISGDKYVRKIGLQVTYGFLFGFCVGSCCLRPLIIVQLFGIKSLTNGLGLMMLYMGVGGSVSVLVGGKLIDYTGEYDWAFYMGSIALITSASFLLCIKRVRKWEKKHGVMLEDG